MPLTISKLPARLVIIVGSLFLLVLSVHFAGIALLRYLVERELHPALPQGTYIGEVHLNLITGLLEVEDFQLRNEGQLRMRFGDLRLDISPWRLLTGELRIEQAWLADGYLRVDRRGDGSFDLGLPPFGDPAGSPGEGTPLDIRLLGAAIERVAIEYHDGDLASALYIEKTEVGTYSTNLSKQQVPLSWRLQWDGRAIAGDATATLDDGQLSAEGRLQSGLLDLGRAQRLARLEPVVEGEAGFDGSFTWQPPRLSMQGGLQAPHLAYGIAGREVRLDALGLPDFALDLVTAPAPVLTLATRDAGQIEGLESTVGEHTISAQGLRLLGTLRYADAGQLELHDLDYRADRLGWRSAGRQVAATGVVLKGQVVQRLGGEDPFPSLNASLAAAGLSYEDGEAATGLQLSTLAFDHVTLSPSAADGVRRLAGSLTLGGGRLSQADNALQWSSLTAQMQGAVEDARPRVSVDLDLQALDVATPAFGAGPLHIAQVRANGLDLGERLHVDRLRLQALRLPAVIDTTALEVAAVELADGSYVPETGAGIGEIVIDGVKTGLVRDKAGVWQHVLSRAGPSDPAAGTGDAPASAGAEPAWKIGAVRVTGDSQILVADRLNPDVQPQRYRIEHLEIGTLSSAAPDADTPFKIALRPDQYSEFVIAGNVRPLADKPYLAAEGHLHGFGLPSVNGLVANDLGHRFLEGQLDDDFRISIAQDRLDMHNALGIAGVAVEAIPDKDGPPLGAAIALLEDRDGNIRLEVPVSGDLTDPQFRVLGALNPIIMKAVAGTAALAIQPLGSVLLVGGLLANQALKVTFAPAPFDPGSTELNAGAKQYLGQLAAKLGEKPKLALRVCGVVVASERHKDKQGQYLDQEAEVLAMAQQRAAAARAHLASQGVGKHQLRACRPSFDPDAAAVPRVDIRF